MANDDDHQPQSRPQSQSQSPTHQQPLSNSSALFGTFPLSPTITPIERVRQSLDILIRGDTNSFEKASQRAITNVSATLGPPATIEQTFSVTPEFCSDRLLLHASAGSLFLECVTLSALLTLARPGFWALPSAQDPERAHFAGVTRTLSITWCRPAPVGSLLKMVGTVLSVSDRMALVRGEIWDQRGRLVAEGRHEVVSLVGNEKAVDRVGKEAVPAAAGAGPKL